MTLYRDSASWCPYCLTSDVFETEWQPLRRVELLTPLPFSFSFDMTNYSPLAVAALATSAAALYLSSAHPATTAQALAPSLVTDSFRAAHSRMPQPFGRNVAGPLKAAGGGRGPLGALGDMASSLFGSGGGGSSPPDPKLDAKVLALTSRSWDDVRAELTSRQTPSESRFRSDLSSGYGPPSPLHNLRLYDESNREEDVRVTLYRDSASWCPYCQKVWLTLEEKRIPYRVERVNMRCYGEKPQSFTRLQPNGNIPVAIIDGKILNQSNDIIFALESMFPENKRLLPDDEAGRSRANELLRLERRLFSAWMYWLTGSARSKTAFVSVLEEVERELRSADGGDFFLGKDASLVDFMFAPFLERLAASLLYYKGYQIRVAEGESTDFPCVNLWFDAMETLDSYRLTKSDYYTHCWDLPPQLGGCTRQEEGGPYESAINGERLVGGTRRSWDLPLEPHNGGIEPDWGWCGDEGAALREATERLSYNPEAIVRFAARGAGSKGMPGYSAPLADPKAVPNDAVQASVDAVLRIVAAAMLEGTEACEAELSGVSEALVKEGGTGFAGDVVASLAYLRDRVGVPRDMRLPAARQLRAHLNWAISSVLGATEEI